MNKTMLLLLMAIFQLSIFQTNSFSQWQYVGGFTYSALYPPNISAADTGTLWVAGGYQSPIIRRSTNGGVNWTSIPTTGISAELFCVWGVDAQTCWVGDGGAPGGSGGNAKVYKTTNAGVSWTTVLTTGGSLGFINGIVFSRTNPQIGIVESDPPGGQGQSSWWRLTTDGGNTWTQINGVSSGQDYALNTLVLIDQLWFGIGSSTGAAGKICWTGNNGSSWNCTNLPLSGSAVSAFTMNTDKLHGASATILSLPNIAITTNGCNSWTAVNVGAGVSGACVIKWVPGTNALYLLGSTGTNLGRKSITGGMNWTVMTTSSIQNISSMDIIYNPSTHIVNGFAVNTDGSCIRLVDTIWTGTGIQSNGSDIPEEYSLDQNYPNPFNPATKIYFALPKASNVTLKVYDLLGHEIKTLVSENKPAGTYSVDFDASSLSSGVYFYTIHAGDFTASKKMTLVK